MTEKPILDILKKVDPEAFAKLCEKAKCLEDPLEYYAKSKNPPDIYHAAELAYDLGKYEYSKDLLTKASEISNEYLARIEREADQISFRYEDSGLMGTAINLFNAKDRHAELQTKILKFRAKLEDKL